MILMIAGPALCVRLSAALLLVGLSACAATATNTDSWSDALAAKDFAAIDQLLGSGDTDPDRPTLDGKTALMFAAQQSDAAIVSRLIAAGADVNATNANGGTPLMYAALGGDATVTWLLLEAGARHDARAKLGWTALEVAAVKGYTSVARKLLASGADPDVRDTYGWTPLMRAVDTRRLEFVRMLLEETGADLSARQESGVMALHIAAASGDPAMVRLLVGHGAERAATDNGGRKAADIAQSLGHAEIADYLSGTEPAERLDGS